MVLVLTRLKGESVIIGDDITVTILEIRGEKVRVGIDAAKHISVHREEIFQKINSEKEQL